MSAEKVRITNFAEIGDGFYRISFITDDGAHSIELDRQNMIRFAHELLKTAWGLE